MFRQLLFVACVPKEWRTDVVTQVHKKGSTTSVGNYRPISVTCVPCKLLEHVVVSKIYDHPVHNGLLCDEQHGFIISKSTCTNLLECLNDWTRNSEKGLPTIVIYIDFCKAFDVIQHDKLFVKRLSYGIGGTLLQWIKNLFTN